MKVIDLNKKSEHKRYASSYFRMTQVTQLAKYLIEGIELAQDKLPEKCHLKLKLGDINGLFFTVLNDDLYSIEESIFNKCSDDYKKRVEGKILDSLKKEEPHFDEFVNEGTSFRRKLDITTEVK